MSLVSNPHEALILDDSAQPRRERAVALKLFPALKSLLKSALNRVRSVALIAHDP
jgi:hypothetical protein